MQKFGKEFDGIKEEDENGGVLDLNNLPEKVTLKDFVNNKR